MIDSRSPSSDIMLNSRLFSTFLGSLVAVTIQSISRVRLFETSWIAAHQASLCFSLLEFAQTHVYCVSDAI